MLDGLEANLVGSGPGNAQAVALREALAERGLSPVHAQDLLKAFRLRRYQAALQGLGRSDLPIAAYSAMPVGRFVLDVHGEKVRDLVYVGCDLRGAADQQPPAGLCQRFSRP